MPFIIQNEDHSWPEGSRKRKWFHPRSASESEHLIQRAREAATETISMQACCCMVPGDFPSDGETWQQRVLTRSPSALQVDAYPLHHTAKTEATHTPQAVHHQQDRTAALRSTPPNKPKVRRHSASACTARPATCPGSPGNSFNKYHSLVPPVTALCTHIPLHALVLISITLPDASSIILHPDHAMLARKPRQVLCKLKVRSEKSAQSAAAAASSSSKGTCRSSVPASLHFAEWCLRTNSKTVAGLQSPLGTGRRTYPFQKPARRQCMSIHCSGCSRVGLQCPQSAVDHLVLPV